MDEVTSFSAGILGDVHSFYQQSFVDLGLDLPSKDGGQASLKVLDYGAGAVIVFDISAAAVATEIVLAEYAPQNRAALQQWIDGDAEAHDWSLFFKYVTEELEGAVSHGASEAEQSTKASVAAEKREERMRKIAKVVQCDIWQDPPIQRDFDVEYDVVFSSLCINSASKSREEFVEATCRLCKLLKSGGRIAMIASLSEGNSTVLYFVGKEKFVALSVTEEMFREALEKAGCYDITVKLHSSKKADISEDLSSFTGMLFATATKH